MSLESAADLAARIVELDAHLDAARQIQGSAGVDLMCSGLEQMRDDLAEDLAARFENYEPTGEPEVTPLGEAVQEIERLRALIAAMVPEYGLKYTEADGRVSYGVFANRAGAERTAAAITGRGWSTVKAEVEERDVSPWRPVKPAEEVPPKPLDVSDTTG